MSVVLNVKDSLGSVSMYPIGCVFDLIRQNCHVDISSVMLEADRITLTKT